MENDINTLKLIATASAHLKVQGIESGIVPMTGTDKSIVIGSPAEVVELMPELRGAIPAAWHNFARAIANLPHGAEANIAGMQSKAAQLLAAEDARARAAQPVAASAGIEGLDKWNASRKHLGAMQMCDGGNYLKRVDVERLLATQSAQGAQPDLHNAIMNLRCDVQNCILGGAQAEMAYKMGHRDARHGAAELVGAHEAGEAAPAAPLQTMDETTRDEALADAEKAVEGALAVARDEALEEAAKLIEEEVPCSCCFSDDEVALATNLAAAIRALMKSASPVSGEAGEKGGES